MAMSILNRVYRNTSYWILIAAQLLVLAIMPAASCATAEDQSGFELSAPAGLSTSNIQDLHTLSSRELLVPGVLKRQLLHSASFCAAIPITLPVITTWLAA
jgi:hypothetical protein